MVVLIESDWNLKDVSIRFFRNVVIGINRIRLEFKGGNFSQLLLNAWVLIESDWNLKIFEGAKDIVDEAGINRIRLEFKGVLGNFGLMINFCINRIRLEFKATSAGIYF